MPQRWCSDRPGASLASSRRQYEKPVFRRDLADVIHSSPRESQLGRRGFRLPEGGGRLRLAGDPEPLWLDLWEGDEEGLAVDEYCALLAAVRMLDLALHPARAASLRS
jgi:hypothetical protein